MFTQSTSAEITAATANVEFPNDPSAKPPVVPRRFNHLPNKFVAQDTPVAAFVASHQL
jgi:hypothetical protein